MAAASVGVGESVGESSAAEIEVGGDKFLPGGEAEVGAGDLGAGDLDAVLESSACSASSIEAGGVLSWSLSGSHSGLVEAGRGDNCAAIGWRGGCGVDGFCWLEAEVRRTLGAGMPLPLGVAEVSAVAALLLSTLRRLGCGDEARSDVLMLEAVRLVDPALDTLSLFEASALTVSSAETSCLAPLGFASRFGFAALCPPGLNAAALSAAAFFFAASLPLTLF